MDARRHCGRRPPKRPEVGSCPVMRRASSHMAEKKPGAFYLWTTGSQKYFWEVAETASDIA